jgi:hypothetical protein
MTELEAFLKSDRQWPRYCRVRHAKMRLARATSEKDKLFWRAVLDANGSHPAPRPLAMRVEVAA